VCIFSITSSVNKAPFATANSAMEITNKVPIEICCSSFMQLHNRERRHMSWVAI
jgi:hypothetical protein